jgi:transcriptional regulator with XRE-family HTH domain
MLNLKQLAKDRWLKQSDIADILGVTQSRVSELMNRPERIRPEIVDKLRAHFGDSVVDAYMIEHLGPQTHVADISILNPAVVEEIKEEIEAIESIPIIPENVTTRPNLDIREYIEESGGELEHINPSQMLKHADMAEKIVSTSMLPTLQPEDIIFVRFLQDKMKIVDGHTYYIDSKNRPTMVRQIKIEENNKVRLIAQNRQFGDIVMDRSDILNIAVIVGLLRMNFSDQYSQLEALRTKKEAQIDKMLSMMEEKEKQQSKLIDFITKE